MKPTDYGGPSNGACLDCHRRYGDEHGFPDLIVPDDVWEAINPGSDGGGMLCPSCICARAYRAGVRAVAYFASGPFEQEAIREEFRAALAEAWDEGAVSRGMHGDADEPNPYREGSPS
jgi:hypothetical protein